MDIIILMIVLFMIFLLITLIMTWVNRSQLHALRMEVLSLRRKLEALMPKDEAKAAQKAKPKKQKVESPPRAAEVFMGARIERVEQAPVPTAATQKSKPRGSFEETFGKWLPVWIGGLALALAGFFLVKYSIETGLLGPGVRVMLGVALGAGLVYAGDWIRNHPTIENATRISQALSGAGIADLYFSIYAASNFYELLSPTLGFIGMAIITAVAIILSLRHGMPIALMGLIGGFVTPALFSSEHPSAPILFSYLYLVSAGLLIIMRQTKWWALGIPSVLGAFIWVVLWLMGGHFAVTDSLWLGLFLLGISATVVFLSRDDYTQGAQDRAISYNLTSLLNYFSLTGATVLMGIVGNASGLGMMAWGLFGLLTLGGIMLAHFEQRLYGFVPWIAMGVNVMMLAQWWTEDMNMLSVMIVGYGLLFTVSGYLLQSLSERPLLWSGLTSAASIGYYLLGYYKLRYRGYIPEDIMFWGVLALSIAGIGIYLLQRLNQEIPQDYPYRQHVLAIYATTVTAFVSIGMGIELPREFLSVAIAAQMLAITWINTRVEIQSLRYIAGILAVVFAYLILPQILLLMQVTMYTVMGAKVYLVKAVPIVDWPWFQLGVPAVCFVLGSILLRAKKDDKIVKAFEVSAIGLLTLMGYYVMRHLFHTDVNTLYTQATFIEAGVITNALFIFGLACFWVGRVYGRTIVSFSATVLSSIAIFRTCYFDIFIANPLFSGEHVGYLPVFNGLMVVYGLPLVWTWIATLEAKPLKQMSFVRFAQAFMLVLGFVFVTLNVRQFFHGDLLNAGILGNGEIYAYSLAWLIFGLGLLIAGTYFKDKVVRIASLVIMILTVGKVFLYDARELEGLLRVFSFLGLGFSLMGLSWFYTKFVFGDKEK